MIDFQDNSNSMHETCEKSDLNSQLDFNSFIEVDSPTKRVQNNQIKYLNNLTECNNIKTLK